MTSHGSSTFPVHPGGPSLQHTTSQSCPPYEAHNTTPHAFSVPSLRFTSLVCLRSDTHSSRYPNSVPAFSPYMAASLGFTCYSIFTVISVLLSPRSLDLLKMEVVASLSDPSTDHPRCASSSHKPELHRAHLFEGAHESAAYHLGTSAHICSGQ